MDQRYGGEFRAYKAMLSEVRSRHTIKENDAAGLEEFVNLVSVLVTTLKVLKRDGDLSNGFFYQELISKLPRSLRME